MARGVNKVILIGHLGADPEVRYMPNSDAVTNITIATSESWIDKQSQEKRESTEWHRVVLYRRLAEIAGEYLRKGSKVYVEGRLRTRKWQDQQNIDRYTTEIIVEDLQMLDGRPDNGGGYNQGDDQQGGYQQGGQQGGPQNRQRAPQSGKTNQPQGGQQNRQRPQQGGQQNNNQPQGGFNQPQGGFNQPQGGDPQGGGGYAQNQGPGRGPMEPPIDFDDDIPF